MAHVSRYYEANPYSNFSSFDQISQYLSDEFRRISAAFSAGGARSIDEEHVEPDKPYEGLTVLADGTNWDPGSGQGVYTYYGGAWNKLG